VEAALVLSIVFLAMMAVIKEAYILHDTVTGSMVLAETAELAACNRDEEKGEEYFSGYGEKRGNPRLWLGKYGIGIRMDDRKITGEASAGEWRLQMEVTRFRPETFLRRAAALKETVDGWDKK